MANDNSIQRRADAGGEFGPNGEWYRGGQFIALTVDRPKGGNLRWSSTGSIEAVHDAEVTEQLAAKAAWLEGRVAQFSALLAKLEGGSPDWFESFPQSLGRQLRAEGSLSPKQAVHAVKAFYGRRVKANAEQFDALVDAVTTKWEAGR